MAHWFTNRIFIRLWESPTFNTWLSYSTKTLSLFVVLPLILKRFSSGEVALWYLFATIISLQGIADLGFRSTFIRLLSYAMAGAKDINTYTKSSQNNSTAQPNLELLEKVICMMRYIYKFLVLILFMLLLVLGTWSMNKPILQVDNQKQAWFAWIIIVIISSIKFYGTIYSNYLEGLNKIALVRRWEALTSVGAIATSIAVLLTYNSILALVLANQFWVLINLFRDFKLVLKVEKGLFKKLNLTHPFEKEFFVKVWQPAWRTGLSGFMSNGLTNITSIIYAQIGSSTHLASYLLALRIIGQIKEVSMAPFYSKIPFFSRLRSQGKIPELIKSAQRGMLLSNLVFVSATITIGLFGNKLLLYIGSDVQFIAVPLWIFITIAFFIHRYGAMHIQLYSTTNHIISHIADGVSGVLFIITTLLLLPKLDLFAIPTGMIIGYLGFYAWYAAINSIKSLDTSFLDFEKKASLLPLLVLFIYIIYNINSFTNGGRNF